MNRLLFILLIVLLAQSMVLTQEERPVDALKYFDENKRWYNTYSEHWFKFFDIAENDVRDSIVQWEKIGSDLTNTSDSLPGTYAFGGETHGDYVRWSWKHGFIWLSVNKCMGGPMRILRGRVEQMPGGVVLIPEISLGSTEHGHGNHAKPSKRIELVAATWIGAQFLIEKDRVASFAEYIAGLGEFNGYLILFDGSPFLMKIGSATAEGKNNPILPSGYEHFLKKPIRGKVVSIGRAVRHVDPDSDTHDDLVTRLLVELENASVGSAKNLELVSVGSEPSFSEKFILKSIRNRVATIEYSRPIPKKNCVVSSYEDCKDVEHIRLRKGMILSTNGY